jgi:hypothetical protein
MIAVERAERCVAVHAAVLALFDDDSIAKLLEGVMDELTAEDVRELAGLDKTVLSQDRRQRQTLSF